MSDSFQKGGFAIATKVSRIAVAFDDRADITSGLSYWSAVRSDQQSIQIKRII